MTCGMSKPGAGLDGGLESSIRAITAKRESLLSPLASISADALRRHNRKAEDIRSPYPRNTTDHPYAGIHGTLTRLRFSHS